jgi:accessory colonization factor AcfC
MEKSQNADSQSSKYRNMGFALHFLADLGNPMHTGNFSDQITNQWVHHTYGISANDHLMFESDNVSGVRNILLNNVNFSKHPEYGPNSYYEVDDPSWYQTWNKWAHHAVRLARLSHRYSDEHIQRTYNIGAWEDVLEEDSTLETQVEYLHAETMKFMMGYVEEYNGDISY